MKKLKNYFKIKTMTLEIRTAGSLYKTIADAIELANNKELVGIIISFSSDHILINVTADSNPDTIYRDWLLAFFTQQGLFDDIKCFGTPEKLEIGPGPTVLTTEEDIDVTRALYLKWSYKSHNFIDEWLKTGGDI